MQSPALHLLVDRFSIHSASARWDPPLTESPGRCRAYELGRAGSLKRQTQRALRNACSKDGESGVRHRVPHRLLESRGAFQERPAMNAGKTTGTPTN